MRAPPGQRTDPVRSVIGQGLFVEGAVGWGRETGCDPSGVGAMVGRWGEVDGAGEKGGLRG